ncbi:hypothetical protein [Collinsella provencensis]
MANALSECKRAADHVCAGNAESGVGRYILNALGVTE